MKSIEEICDYYSKNPEQVESDLRFVLKCISVGLKAQVESYEYYISLVDCLHQKGFIRRGTQEEILQRGRNALRRGWILIDIKRVKKEKRIKFLKWLLPILISSIIGILTILI